MNYNRQNRSKNFVHRVAIVLLVMTVARYGFAVDSLIDGGKKSKTFSTIKADIQFSLKSRFHFQNYKLTSVRKTPNMVMSNYYITYHRGNVTMAIPHKGKSKIMQKFKTPERGH